MIGELDEEQIDQVLRTETVGRIGCHAEGRTYVVPVTYAYEDGCVYGHSRPGRKLSMMRANPHVCFEVDHVDDMAHWRSVIAWGRFEPLHGQDAEEGMQILLRRLVPLVTSETAGPVHSVREPRPSEHPWHGPGEPEGVVYRIRLTAKTGRFEKR
jgi:uncharacterized protein